MPLIRKDKLTATAMAPTLMALLVTGMLLGTLFTLFVVPVFYLLLAADHQKEVARDAEFGRATSDLPDPSAHLEFA